MPTLEYPVLLDNMEVVFQRAHDGAKTCKAFATLIQQTAALEEGYGNSIVKVCELSREGRKGGEDDDCWGTRIVKGRPTRAFP